MKLILDFYFNQKKISEVAKDANVSNQTVYTRIRNSLSKLNSQFNGFDHEKQIAKIAS
jgi:predicted DNA-binding protein YlxM (UPF0122 family)